MCFSGGSDYETPEIAPEPETVKQVEAEVTRARTDAKTAAAKKYGITGTNVTKGALAGEMAEAKKKTLGGA